MNLQKKKIMKSTHLIFAIIIVFSTNFLYAQDYYPLALNNKWTYEIYDDGEAFAVSTLEIVQVESITDSTTLFVMEGFETGIPPNVFQLIENLEIPEVVFISLDLNQNGIEVLVNWQFHSYTVGDTITILLSDYLVKDYGNYTTMKGLSFDDCLLLESIDRELDLVIAPDVGIVAQFEVDTPTLNMLELIEFKTDTELISNIQPIFSNFELDVYPNPTSDFLIVNGHTNSTNSKLKLFDMNGSPVFNDYISGKKKIDISNLTGGQYVLRVESKDGNVWTQKVVIQ
jgi:hypothetical protein